MNEELLQRDLIKNPDKIGKWDFYNIGATTVKALKESNIIRNVDYGDEEKKKVDALIVLKKSVIAVIEYKKPDEFKTKKQQDNAITQEINVARKLGAKIIIATDTQDTVWVNVCTGNRIKDETGVEVKFRFDPKDENLPGLIEKINYSISELNDNIKPKELVNPTDLAKQIWQDIWSVSGATPENCLYTFVEIFIFKYLSDLGVLQGMYSFNTLMDSYVSNNQDEVLEMYANTVRPKIKQLFPENPLDKTTIINGTIFVSKDQKAVKGYSTVFKKVLDKFKTYGKLEHIDYDFKSQLFESFLKESISKKNWGQFFTPLKVVRAVVEMAKDDIKEGIKICDPACGVGKFLLEPIITKLEHLYTVNKSGITPKITIRGFDKGFDKDEQKTIILAKANMLIYFSDLIKENAGATQSFSTLFNQSFELKTNSILGTLSDDVTDEYDLILTNPPYVTSGSSNLKEEIRKDGSLSSHYKINALGVEGLFMEWIIRALKPGGKAFIIVPDGIFNRKNDKNLRQFLIDQCYIDAIISLPIKTFFTTPKKTYILAIRKKENVKQIQNDPIFTYLVSEIGESRDVYRFDIEQNDLREAVTLFSFFKGNKQSFERINNDARCKIQPFSKFGAESNWCIDRWWTKEEKDGLGINEDNLKIKVEEFPNLIDEVSNSLSSIKEEAISLNENKVFPFISKKISEIFDLSTKTNGSKFTKSFIDKNKGTIPVYSASKFPDIVDYGYVKDNLEGIKYFENCLTWNIDGSIGKVYFRKGRFSLSEKVIPLILRAELKDKLDLEYLKYTIETEFAKRSFGFDNKAGKGKIQDIEIKIPVKEDGEIDLEMQKSVSEKYKRIEAIKKSITEELEKLTSSEIDFE